MYFDLHQGIVQIQGLVEGRPIPDQTLGITPDAPHAVQVGVVTDVKPPSSSVVLGTMVPAHVEISVLGAERHSAVAEALYLYGEQGISGRAGHVISGHGEAEVV